MEPPSAGGPCLDQDDWPEREESNLVSSCSGRFLALRNKENQRVALPSCAEDCNRVVIKRGAKKRLSDGAEATIQSEGSFKLPMIKNTPMVYERQANVTTGIQQINSCQPARC